MLNEPLFFHFQGFRSGLERAEDRTVITRPHVGCPAPIRTRFYMRCPLCIGIAKRRDQVLKIVTVYHPGLTVFAYDDSVLRH